MLKIPICIITVILFLTIYFQEIVEFYLSAKKIFFRYKSTHFPSSSRNSGVCGRYSAIGIPST